MSKADSGAQSGAPITAGAVGGEKAAPTKLWLWRNGPHEFWAFEHCYPIHMDNDDPQTLGEPCGYAIVKPSRSGRPPVEGAPEDYSYRPAGEAELLAALRAMAVLFIPEGEDPEQEMPLFHDVRDLLSKHGE